MTWPEGQVSGRGGPLEKQSSCRQGAQDRKRVVTPYLDTRRCFSSESTPLHLDRSSTFKADLEKTFKKIKARTSLI